MKALKVILIIIGSLTVLVVLAVVVFMQAAPNEVKERLYKETGIENLNVEEEIYVKCEVTKSRKNLLGDKWVINGKLYTTSDVHSYSKQEVEFQFSDGVEVRYFNFNLNGDQLFARPFQVRIEGHSSATFLGVEVVAAN